MTRVLILADIHANFHALSALMQEAGAYDLMLCAGDIVGYYDQPNKVCAYLKSLPNAHIIRGNHDAYVTGAMSPSAENIVAYRTEWTKSALTSDNSEWLRSLPPEITLDVDGWAIMLRHANPWDEERYIYPDSHHLLKKIHLEDKNMLVLGHTHHPMIRKCGAGLLVNPGSVGQPRDRNPNASYAMFDTRTGEADINRAAYDVAGYQKHLVNLGWPHKMVEILSRTKG